MILKRIQLGLIHVAVAMTLVPINSTLNRVMIKELELSATLVAVMASLPYFLSPIQVAIGSFADRHPVFGWRRTPYILVGLLLCVLGVVLSPLVAFILAEDFWAGLLVSVFAFGTWGMGFNFATVSYLSLASELSGEEGRGRTVAVMWFMMIVGIILTSFTLSHLVDPYTPEALTRAFWTIGLAAFALGLFGLLRLERRTETPRFVAEERYPWRVMLQSILVNRQATLFFVYLAVLLTALLGQDILLEPFAAEAFGMSVRETTRITSIWGGFTLAALLLAGVMERRVGKRRVAAWGGWGALLGFIMISTGGLAFSRSMFYSGLFLLGIGTGLSTVSNLSLMLDMTAAGKVGLFIGAWGMANAVSRLTGSLLGGALRDILTQLTGARVLAYALVFLILAVLMLISLMMLRRIDVRAFQQQSETAPLVERAALAGEV